MLIHFVFCRYEAQDSEIKLRVGPIVMRFMYVHGLIDKALQYIYSKVRLCLKHNVNICVGLMSLVNPIKFRLNYPKAASRQNL